MEMVQTGKSSKYIVSVLFITYGLEGIATQM